jgi:hypothetical protein
MFELFQNAADGSVAFHLCKRSPSFPTLYFSLAIFANTVAMAPSREGLAPAGWAGPEGLRGDADQRNLFKGYLLDTSSFVVSLPACSIRASDGPWAFGAIRAGVRA